MPNDIKEYVKAFGSYLQNRKKSRATVQTYTQTVRYLFEQTNKTPQTLIMIDIENFANWIRNRLCANAQKSKCSAIKKYLIFIKREYGNLLYNTYREECEETGDDILKPEPPELPEKDTLTKAEIIKIFKLAEKNPRDIAILTMFLKTAQRVGSIQNLNISDIDFEGKEDVNGRVYHEVTIRQAKGNKTYVIEIQPDTIDILNTYLKYREEPHEGFITNNYGHKLYHKDALFLNGINGKRLLSQAMGVMMKRYAFKSGLKKRMYNHIWRATAITLMDEGGMTIHQIMKQSGHRDSKSLNTYIRPKDDVVRKKVFNSLSLKETKPDPEPTPQRKQPDPEPKPVTKPITKPNKEEDKTDRYIALLKDGSIGKEEFLKLMDSEKKSEPQNYFQ